MHGSVYTPECSAQHRVLQSNLSVSDHWHSSQCLARWHRSNQGEPAHLACAQSHTWQTSISVTQSLTQSTDRSMDPFQLVFCWEFNTTVHNCSYAEYYLSKVKYCKYEITLIEHSVWMNTTWGQFLNGKSAHKWILNNSFCTGLKQLLNILVSICISIYNYVLIQTIHKFIIKQSVYPCLNYWQQPK